MNFSNSDVAPVVYVNVFITAIAVICSGLKHENRPKNIVRFACDILLVDNCCIHSLRGLEPGRGIIAGGSSAVSYGRYCGGPGVYTYMATAIQISDSNGWFNIWLWFVCCSAQSPLRLCSDDLAYCPAAAFVRVPACCELSCCDFCLSSGFPGFCRRQYCNMSNGWIDKHENRSKADIRFDCGLLCGTDSRVFRFHSSQSTELMFLQMPPFLLDGSVLKICKNFRKGAFKCKYDR